MGGIPQQQNQTMAHSPPPQAAPGIRTSLGLTPQEMRIVQYHDKTIETGTVGKDDEGRPVTVYSIGIKIPKGEPNAGKFVSVPGYNRETRKIMNEGDAYKRYKKEIGEGSWPLYNSGSELNERSRAIHQIMDNDAGKANRR